MNGFALLIGIPEPVHLNTHLAPKVKACILITLVHMDAKCLFVG